MSGSHTFHAAAFVENFNLREIAQHYSEAKRTPHELSFQTDAGGTVFIYAFGAVVFLDMSTGEREREMLRIRNARPGLTETQPIAEEFTVREREGARPDMANGVLVLNQLTAERASIVAITVAQSAAMEYYERIVDQMFGRTDKLVDRLEQIGTVPLSTKPLHKFIGAAIGTRSEVLSILHLLDKPDATWEDPGVDNIYEELRAEFDLVDRYQALELKLRSVQEALELVLDVARDRRLVLLEGSIVLLIVIEIVINVFWH